MAVKHNEGKLYWNKQAKITKANGLLHKHPGHPHQPKVALFSNP